MSLQVKMKRLKLTLLATPKRAVPVLMSLDDETLPDDIKQLIKENNVESIVFRDKQDSMNGNSTITYKQRDEDCGYVSYEFFIVK